MISNALILLVLALIFAAAIGKIAYDRKHGHPCTGCPACSGCQGVCPTAGQDPQKG